MMRFFFQTPKLSLVPTWHYVTASNLSALSALRSGHVMGWRREHSCHHQTWWWSRGDLLRQAHSRRRKPPQTSSNPPSSPTLFSPNEGQTEWGAWCYGLVESLLTLRALYVPGLVNRGAELTCRGGLLPVEWRLNPSMVEQIWTQFRRTNVDLFSPATATPTVPAGSPWFLIPESLSGQMYLGQKKPLYAFLPLHFSCKDWGRRSSLSSCRHWTIVQLCGPRPWTVPQFRGTLSQEGRAWQTLCPSWVSPFGPGPWEGVIEPGWFVYSCCTEQLDEERNLVLSCTVGSVFSSLQTIVDRRLKRWYDARQRVMPPYIRWGSASLGGPWPTLYANFSAALKSKLSLKKMLTSPSEWGIKYKEN